MEMRRETYAPGTSGQVERKAYHLSICLRPNGYVQVLW